MTVPGIVLSQPERATTPSKRWPRATSSMESATTSRLTSDAFIPSVPMLIPSVTTTVLNSMGVPPAARTYFKAIGFTDADLARPLVGVAHCWIEITPCNWNHRKLAEKVKEGIRAAGGTPIEFNTISVTDGIAMGTEGMKASLVSREAIADSVELVVRGHLLDGFVGISGCDKTIPAMVMAMARLNVPSLMLYGG